MSFAEAKDFLDFHATEFLDDEFKNLNDIKESHRKFLSGLTEFIADVGSKYNAIVEASSAIEKEIEAKYL